MGSAVKVRIVPDNGTDSYKSTRELPRYPDTGETGETYDMELEERRPEPDDVEAMESAAEFLRLQREQASEAVKKASINRTILRERR